MARSKEEGETLLQILPGFVPEVLPTRQQQQREFTVIAVHVSAPIDDKQVLQNCQNLNFT